MISWIVSSHEPHILYANLVGSLMHHMADDEIVLVEDAPSIAKAYNEGQGRAKHRIRVYVHHDVDIADPPRLRQELVATCTPEVGMVGLVGSRTAVWPWWDGSVLGSVWDRRTGVLNLGPGGHCAVLDGLLLATVHDVEWDESYPGWHGYDHDMCAQMTAKGLHNFCLTDGHLMVRHNTRGPLDPDHLEGWQAAERRYREKWGV